MRKTMVALAVSALAACGGGDDTTVERASTTVTARTAETSTTTTTELEKIDASKAAREYFAAFASYSVAGMTPMVDVSLEGSPARAYAIIQIAAVKATVAEGMPDGEESEVRPSGSSIQLCDSLSGEEECTTFADFVADEQGRLMTFTVNGTSIDDRILLGDGAQQQAGGATFTLVGAYDSVQADGLTVLVDVQAGDRDITVYGTSAEYVNPDGAQQSVSQTFGSSDLRAGASGTVEMFFDNADVGGTIYIPGYAADASYEVQFKL